MKTLQVRLTASSKFDVEVAKLKAMSPQLILMFGSGTAFADGWVKKATAEFPKATVLGCSTAGEISNSGVFEGSLVMTGVHFDHAPELRTASATVDSMATSKKTGHELGQRLKDKNLKAVFVLGRGLDINGSALLEGMQEAVGAHVAITGGLAGDLGKFVQTFTILNGEVADNKVVAVGICGESVGVSFGSRGGWKTFGPIRRVTKSNANVLFEIDGQPALDIYKKYLGDKADGLPASALLYPFALLKDNQDTLGLIRTILAVNNEDKSVVFAGDIPNGSLVRLMHANNEGLVEGAKDAASSAFDHHGGTQSGDKLGILVSCVGRKLVMGSDIEDEIDAVREVFGDVTLTGFYSYGEICPQKEGRDSKLHNQTMTVTYLYETKSAS